MRKYYFYSCSVSFFLGIFAFSFFDAGRTIVVFVAILLVASATRYFPRIVFFSILCFALGAARIEVSKSGVHIFDSKISQKIEARGTICDEPAQRANSQGICFQPDGWRDKILISAAKSPAYLYGERLDVAGKLELPKNFLAYENGPEFDYVAYLAKDDIRYVMRRPKMAVIGKDAGSWLIASLIWLKNEFMSRISAVMPDTHAALVGGLLLGTKGALPQKVSDDFKRSGLTHILVLSGSNVTVVAEALLRIFAFLPRSAAQAAGAFSIILFALMTGASATTVRATIMALIGLLAQAMGRRYDVVRALVVSAVVMLVQNPRILAFDISFQLSFLATIAVIFVSPLVKERLGWVPERFGMREILSMTLATQLFTFPFIFFKMGEISVIALLPNLLVLPIVPYAMLGGFATGMIGFLGAAISLPAGWVTGLMLEYMLRVTAFFSSFPFATIKATLGSPFLFISYAVFAALIIWLRKRTQSRSLPSPS